MEIKDQRKLDDYGMLEHIDVGDVVQFKNEREDGDVLFWLKTDNETTSHCHCVSLEDGSLEWFKLDTECFIVNAKTIVRDYRI